MVVVPRGIRFNVTLMDGPARGYVLEVFQGHFVLPDLGPIGRFQACRVYSMTVLVLSGVSGGSVKGLGQHIGPSNLKLQGLGEILTRDPHAAMCWGCFKGALCCLTSGQ